MGNKTKIALPHAARSLCFQAIKLSNQLAIGKSHADMMKAAASLKRVSEHTKAIGIQNIRLPDYDYFNLFNVPTDLEKLSNTLKNMGLLANFEAKPEGLWAELEDSDEKVEASILLFTAVQELKKAEDEVTQSSKRITYAKSMEKLDKQILVLANLLTYAKTLEPAKELFTTKFQRKSGAQKGGLKKKERFEELKSMILEEAATNHSDKSGAKAARAIYEKLGHDNNWLRDSKGKAISQDPVTLFTRWINADRRNQ